MLRGIRAGIRGIWAGIHDAYADALGPGGLAYASPAIAAVGALVLAYGIGVFLYDRTGGTDTSILVAATLIAVPSMIAGVGTGWWLTRHGARSTPSSAGISDATSSPASAPSADERAAEASLLWVVGLALLAFGLAASVVYLLVIGELPILMASVEQARVEAAEKGGALLRVAGLLALPGAWLAVAAGVASRRPGRLALAALAVIAVAAVQIATANRSPAFNVVEVSVAVALLVGGRLRLGIRGLVAVAVAVVLFVGAAGVVGAYRFYHTPQTWTDPRVWPAVRDDHWDILTEVAISNYLVVPAQNFDSTLQAVPALIGWRVGYSYVQPLLTVLPGHQTTFDQDLKTALQQTYAGGGTVPSILGEAYANFGMFGWLLVPFAVGFALAWLYRTALRLGRAAVWTLYAFTIVHVVGANLSGLSVASVFPWLAIGILGGVAILVPRLGEGPLRLGPVHLPSPGPPR